MKRWIIAHALAILTWVGIATVLLWLADHPVTVLRALTVIMAGSVLVGTAIFIHDILEAKP